jgi:predicted DCC family thiol-disulfide oxidoreductase YuxK
MDRPIVLFDGVCNLCNASVRWIIERDAPAQFRFASLQSRAAQEALSAAFGNDGAGERPDSIVLIDADGVHVRSEAALRIARRLGFPYSLLGAARLIPRPVRDLVYRVIARYRYQWFGRLEACAVPDAELAARFLDAGEAPDGSG